MVVSAFFSFGNQHTQCCFYFFPPNQLYLLSIFYDINKQIEQGRVGDDHKGL